jgi:hypothetical protein
LAASSLQDKYGRRVFEYIEMQVVKFRQK